MRLPADDSGGVGRLRRGFAWAADGLAWFGAALMAVVTLWISYGVVARYAFRAPDALVTEATALLLVPIAFLGLAHAFKSDALPRVTLLLDVLPGPVKRALDIFNLMLMAAIGVFFATVAVKAVSRTWRNGSVSNVIEWPEFWLWIPVALAFVVFIGLAMIRLAENFLGGER
ncbi:TRAP transporter small permease [Pikeienuella piscinae]|uniref:TRAP transporter small permease protein n=1 Tax=Pikeienuella piscinae TaxID=2748098 RepID=A0A7L5C1F1_9RHOB|nr:TRAP transporter small permease subunit [Pikeienuella piscinae]QIE56637.1 TRAP transporter small permease [Pikeienuella piscinae]